MLKPTPFVRGHKIRNTGRTRFKKGDKPWNVGKKMPYTKARKEYDDRQRGVTKPKPKNFSETMRKVNPPIGRKISSGGYVYIYQPEYSGSCKKVAGYGYIQEHRYLLGRLLGRVLTSTEKVHHLNGVKSDNRIENLVLCASTKEHNLIHHRMELFVYGLIKDGRVYYDGEEFKIR